MKTVALALGAGGARGLSHIAVFEALDELGVKPVSIAGSSIGAVARAVYAPGMTRTAPPRPLRSSSALAVPPPPHPPQAPNPGPTLLPPRAARG